MDDEGMEEYDDEGEGEQATTENLVSDSDDFSDSLAKSCSTTTEQAIDTAQYTRPTRAAMHNTPARTIHNIHSTQQHAH